MSVRDDPKPPPVSPESITNAQLILRMLALAWHYRWGCIKILVINLILLSMGIAGLGFMGTGIDFLRYTVHQRSVSVAGDAPSAALDTAGPGPVPSPPAQEIHVKAPRWPLGITPPRGYRPMRILALLSGVIVLFALLRALLSMANVIVTNRLVQGRIVVDLRARVYEKMQQLSFRFFDANASGSLINRVTGDVQAVRSFIDGVVIQAITLVLSLVIYIVYMVRIHSWLTAACLASTPFLWVLTATFSRIVRPEYHACRTLYDRMILALSENIQGVHVVKGFARQVQQQRRFGDLNGAYRDRQFWIFRTISSFQPLIGFMTHVNLVIMLGYGGYLVVRHDQAADAAVAASVGLSIGQLLVFAGLLQQFSNQVGNITQIANSVQQSLIGAQRVFEVLDTRTEIQSPRNPVRIRKCTGEICFDKVSFSYSQDEPVLQNLSFTVKAGECASILGQTGSGKSTLLGLIPRFYDPQAGKVLVDGTEVTRMDVEELRRMIGIVFQESFLFSNTVAANIAFGHPDATREQIERAARIASAHDFVMRMPKGYDTILHEGGANLSGGQRQRLAIARAILLEPPILLLDDPTASIDPETEEEIMTAIANAMEGRTTFVVAHRLSTLRRSDRVIVLNRGRIVQTGTHEELMNAEGHYRMAANLQIPDQESLTILGEGLGAPA